MAQEHPQAVEFAAVVIPLVTSHAPMLGRTLLSTALTRASLLVVLVGQKKALFLAVRDWRRSPRHTALGRLLDGKLQLRWPSHSYASDDTLPVGMEALTVGATDE